MSRLIIISILFTIFSATAAFSNTSTSPAKQVSENPFFLMDYSPTDEDIAREIIDLNSSLRRLEKNKRAIKNLKEKIGNSLAFKEFEPLISWAHTLFMRKTTRSNFQNRCNQSTKKYDSPVAWRLTRSLQDYCLKKFLEVFQGHRIQGKDFHYFIQNIGRLSDHQFHDELSNFLKEINRENTRAQISEVIIDHAINRNLTLPQKIMENIHINERLTSHVQTKGRSGNGDRSVFHRALKKITKKAQSYATKGKGQKSLNAYRDAAQFFIQNRKHISDFYAYKNFLFISEDLVYNSHSTQAKSLAADALGLFRGEKSNEFKFMYLWADIIPENYETALKSIEKLDIDPTDSETPQKLKYWTAHIYLENDYESKGKSLLSALVKKSPLNYYSILATKELGRIAPEQNSVDDLFSATPDLPLRMGTLDQNDIGQKLKSTVARLNIWLDLEMNRWAYSEMKSLLNNHPVDVLINEKMIRQLSPKSFRRLLIKNLVSLTNHKGNYLQTFKLVYSSMKKELLHVDQGDIKFLFPLHYFQKVRNIDEGIDPVIVLSLIRQESAFNPTAVSSAGARGLMQLMPPTARMLRQHVRTHELENPETNLEIGISYLKRLLKRYDGNLVYALAAYNAGEHRVKQWKKELFKNDNPLKMIEAIPFQETRLYVKLIYRNIFFYRMLKESVDFSKSIEESFRVSVRH